MKSPNLQGGEKYWGFKIQEKCGKNICCQYITKKQIFFSLFFFSQLKIVSLSLWIHETEKKAKREVHMFFLCMFVCRYIILFSFSWSVCVSSLYHPSENVSVAHKTCHIRKSYRSYLPLFFFFLFFFCSQQIPNIYI